MALTFVTWEINDVSGMDACRASSCCHGARSALWMEVPAVPLARAMRAVPVPVQAAVAVAGAAVPRPAGVRQRRWRSWISNPQQRPTRLSIRWTNEPLPHSTMSHNIFSTGSPLTGRVIRVIMKHSVWIATTYDLKHFFKKEKCSGKCMIYYCTWQSTLNIPIKLI